MSFLSWTLLSLTWKTHRLRRFPWQEEDFSPVSGGAVHMAQAACALLQSNFRPRDCSRRNCKSLILWRVVSDGNTRKNLNMLRKAASRLPRPALIGGIKILRKCGNQNNQRHASYAKASLCVKAARVWLEESEKRACQSLPTISNGAHLKLARVDEWVQQNYRTNYTESLQTLYRQCGKRGKQTKDITRKAQSKSNAQGTARHPDQKGLNGI